jgi:hypothetical protein
MINTNKRYIILFLGVVVLFILFAIVVFLQQPPKQQHLSSQDQNVISFHRPNQKSVNIPSVTLLPPASTPKAAAQLFYSYYFSSPNPLANGAYKNNPYLSQDFKNVIGSLYKNGNTPVFCLQNRRAQIIVGKEQSVYYNNGYLEQEVISEAAPGTKDLYIVLLEDDGGKWLIFDINCI